MSILKSILVGLPVLFLAVGVIVVFPLVIAVLVILVAVILLAWLIGDAIRGHL